MRNRIKKNQTLTNDDQVLAVASLFEKEFSIDWIQELTGQRATHVLSTCETAVCSGILIRQGIGSFSFDNEKVRLSFEKHLPETDIEQLHQRIAAMFIKDLPQSDQKALLLAPHLLNIFNDVEHCIWLYKAARKYQSDFQTDMALKCYLKILDDLTGLHQIGVNEVFCDAAIEYAKLNTARSDVKKVVSILEEAMFRAKTIKNQRYQSLIDMNFAKSKWLQSQYKSALGHFQNAWNLASQMQDESLIRSLDNFRTFLLYWQGLFKDAVLDYEKSHTDIEKYPHERFPLLATMTVGVCYGQSGQVTQGIGMIDSIRRHCLDIGDTGLAAHSSICIGAVLLDIGHIDDALLHLVPAVEAATRMAPDWIAIQGELILAYAYYLHGNNELSIKHVGRFYQLSNLVDVSVRPWPYLMELCWAAEIGLYPLCPEISIRKEVDAMVDSDNVFLKGVAYRFKALLCKKDGQPYDTILGALKKSIDFLEISGHAIELAKTRLELARIFLLQSNRTSALKMAESACDVLIPLNKNLIPDDLKPLIVPTFANENQLKELFSISKNLSVAASRRDAVAYIISTANRMTGAERGGIFLLEQDQYPYSFSLRASKNLTQEQTERAEFSDSIKLMAEVVASGEGRIQDLRIQDNPDAPDVEIVLSSICVPILVNRKVIGVLYSDNRLLSNAFNTSHIDVLCWLASYATLVLEIDHLKKEKKRLNEQINTITAQYEKNDKDRETVHFENIIGESKTIKKVLDQIIEIAPTDTTVLILGETGVGKELAARELCRRSQRQNEAFITLNCSALSEKLIYSELFGHEKGSFTGADRRHIGRFEKANGGTLFLDEIGDLPMNMQVRLLRVLESKEFERVGGKETIHSDFRLITATNRNLEQQIRRKTFRSDLFYRIKVYPIEIPPLRERRDDIPLLVDYFLKRQNRKTGKIHRPITLDEMSVLIDYHWPGNVRELKNLVERYVVSSRERIIDYLAERYHTSPLVQKHAAITLADNERRHIEWALKKTAGKIHGPGGAAELLDIHPNTLSFRIKKLGIMKNLS